jgi:hypothetical protein
MQHLTLARVLLVLTPFGLLVADIVSLTRTRTVLYYLTVIRSTHSRFRPFTSFQARDSADPANISGAIQLHWKH